MASARSTALSLLWLARPKGAWLVAILPLIGFGYGLWERGSTVHPGYVLDELGLLFAAWIVGHAGAMWLNAVLDRDHGPVLLGRAVPVPRGTAFAGYLALAGSVAVAWPLGLVPALCTAGCAVLAVLYSHPRVALKGRAIGGPLVNGVGYGTLSPLAGWAAADGVLTWRTAATLGLVLCFILGAYFAAQAFQQDEDGRRGYRTLVVTHGPRWTLGAARACLLVASVGLVGLCLAGVYPRALLVAAPGLLFADRHLARWRRVPGGGDGRWAARLVARLGVTALLVVGGAYAHHVGQLLRDAPPGGCGTAIVPDALTDACG
ncbi:MAG TPA: UbiA family prenyltransferase [Sandaracinaceae bacterium LLY-WYZ-13_1]|nr:UbiA family prenyltransferase [Sandaracinaceae bacterium LLY-WYZ-13_1]